MAGVMLLFAFSMSCVINLVENKLNQGEEFKSKGETEEMVKD